ncbi:hypothetical protein Spla01_06373 [Streptomyces platensis]|uniref:Uncharacterized protein n=1 Tax=Streptomyces platensis TaxID=58346 RepID=A0ABX3XWG2_STRPT|nr:hypothetical protein [Streptomyces platensis]OSY44955.1 hypothetical protein BG653_03555 [Streptomyces platensis]
MHRLMVDRRLRTYYEGAGYAVAGERSKKGNGGSRYGVTLLEKRLGA